MYTKSIRKNILSAYTEGKRLLAGKIPYIYAPEYSRPKVVSKFPGPNHLKAIQQADATYNFDGAMTVRLSFFNFLAHPAIHQP